MSLWQQEINPYVILKTTPVADDCKNMKLSVLLNKIRIVLSWNIFNVQLEHCLLKLKWVGKWLLKSFLYSLKTTL